MEYYGIWPVMLCPFDVNGKVDYKNYANLVQWYIDKGVHGIFAVCLATEMHSLSDDEKVKLASIAVNLCEGKLPVAATACNLDENVENDIELINRYADVGVDISVLTLPRGFVADNRLMDYYQQVMAATNCDLGLYECPQPSPKILLDPQITAELAKTCRFKAFKETSCDKATIIRQIEACEGTKLKILQANTPLMLAALDAGGTGVMGPVNNIAPELSVKVYEDYIAGLDVTEMHELLSLINYCIMVDYITSMKYILSIQGIDILPQTRDGNVYPARLQLQADYSWRCIEARTKELLKGNVEC